MICAGPENEAIKKRRRSLKDWLIADFNRQLKAAGASDLIQSENSGQRRGPLWYHLSYKGPRV